MANSRLARYSAVAMAVTRTGLGITAVARPELLAQPWLGNTNGSGSLPTVQILGRASGGKDLALGLGALFSLATLPERAVPWLAAGGLADAVDGAATLISWRELPSDSRWKFLSLATGTAIASGLICAGLAAGTERPAAAGVRAGCRG